MIMYCYYQQINSYIKINIVIKIDFFFLIYKNKNFKKKKKKG